MLSRDFGRTQTTPRRSCNRKISQECSLHTMHIMSFQSPRSPTTIGSQLNFCLVRHPVEINVATLYKFRAAVHEYLSEKLLPEERHLRQAVLAVWLFNVVNQASDSLAAAVLSSMVDPKDLQRAQYLAAHMPDYVENNEYLQIAKAICRVMELRRVPWCIELEDDD